MSEKLVSIYDTADDANAEATKKCLADLGDILSSSVVWTRDTRDKLIEQLGTLHGCVEAARAVARKKLVGGKSGPGGLSSAGTDGLTVRASDDKKADEAMRTLSFPAKSVVRITIELPNP